MQQREKQSTDTATKFDLKRTVTPAHTFGILSPNGVRVRSLCADELEKGDQSKPQRSSDAEAGKEGRARGGQGNDTRQAREWQAHKVVRRSDEGGAEIRGRRLTHCGAQGCCDA
jgi:hypothetical protein